MSDGQFIFQSVEHNKSEAGRTTCMFLASDIYVLLYTIYTYLVSLLSVWGEQRWKVAKLILKSSVLKGSFDVFTWLIPLMLFFYS